MQLNGGSYAQDDFIAAITALTITAVSVVPTVPILAEKQTPVERFDEPVSVDVLELMSKAQGSAA